MNDQEDKYLGFATLNDTKNIKNKDVNNLSIKNNNVLRNSKNSENDVLNSTGSKFNFLSQIKNTRLFLILMLIWIVVFVFEYLITGLSVKSLQNWPVIMGNVSNISFLHPLMISINHFIQVHYIIGLFIQLLMFLVQIVFMIIVASLAIFMHASSLHLFSNLFLFLICAVTLNLLHYNSWTICKKWFKYSFFGILPIWLFFELISIFGQLFLNSHSSIYLVVHSNTPIMGASVGIYGLLGFILSVFIKQTFSSFNKSLFVIIYGLLIFMLMYQRYIDFISVKLNTSLGVAFMLTFYMHLSGFLLGLGNGFLKKK